MGALPGRVIQGLKRAGVADPVMLLDEVDKLGRDAVSQSGERPYVLRIELLLLVSSKLSLTLIVSSTQAVSHPSGPS